MQEFPVDFDKMPWRIRSSLIWDILLGNSATFLWIDPNHKGFAS